MPRLRRSPVFIATIGALALTLPLAACGRKGPHDPPPGGQVLDGGVVRTPTTRSGVLPRQDEPPPNAPPAYDENGRPIPPPGQKKKFIGDWLID